MRRFTKRHVRPSSFTLVEMLTVIAIIAILCGLTLYAFGGAMKSAARSRAKSEISALTLALENYKADNGAYPSPETPIFTQTNDYNSASSSVALGQYQQSSAFLYQSLSGGMTNYGDPVPVGAKVYYVFKKSQLGNDTLGAGAPIYIKDPFGNSYGYFPGYVSGATTNAPNNGAGQFDLWSTAGDTVGTNMPSWVTDWNN